METTPRLRKSRALCQARSAKIKIDGSANFEDLSAVVGVKVFPLPNEALEDVEFGGICVLNRAGREAQPSIQADSLFGTTI